MKNSGFTLIELSIVLLIIALIVAGIIGGQSLLFTAKINSQIQQLRGFEVAVNAFQLKYDAVPGDMSNAEAYWGSANTNDGNGDGKLNSDSGIFPDSYNSGSENFDGEFPEFFRHLSLSEIIAEQYDGSNGPTSIGFGYPKTVLARDNGQKLGMIAAHMWQNNLTCRQTGLKLLMIITKPSAMPNINTADDYIVSSRYHMEARSTVRLDTKMDDGIADTGSFCAYDITGCHTNGVYNVDGNNRYCISWYGIGK